MFSWSQQVFVMKKDRLFHCITL